MRAGFTYSIIILNFLLSELKPVTEEGSRHGRLEYCLLIVNLLHSVHSFLGL